MSCTLTGLSRLNKLQYHRPSTERGEKANWDKFISKRTRRVVEKMSVQSILIHIVIVPCSIVGVLNRLPKTNFLEKLALAVKHLQLSLVRGDVKYAYGSIAFIYGVPKHMDETPSMIPRFPGSLFCYSACNLERIPLFFRTPACCSTLVTSWSLEAQRKCLLLPASLSATS